MQPSRRRCSSLPPRDAALPASGGDDEADRSALHRADDGGRREALGTKQLEHGIGRPGIATDEQAAGGLWIGEQVARGRRQRRRQLDLAAVAGPVASRGAGDETLARERGDAAQQRHLGPLDLDAQAGASRHLERVSRQSETGDVGDRMHGGQVGQRHAGRIEPRRGVDQAPVAIGVERAFLQRRRQHADADRLAEDEHVAGLRVGVAPHLLRMDQAHHDEPVDRLDRIDGVAAGDRNPGRLADRFAAADDLADLLDRELVDGHRDQGQGHDRPAAHRIDVADGVGGGDAAKVVRVVDDGHEEIGGGDQRLLVVEAIDGGVVGGLDADQQFLRHDAAGARAQDLREHGRRDPATAAAAVREAGAAKCGHVHAHSMASFRSARGVHPDSSGLVFGAARNRRLVGRFRLAR